MGRGSEGKWRGDVERRRGEERVRGEKRGGEKEVERLYKKRIHNEKNRKIEEKKCYSTTKDTTTTTTSYLEGTSSLPPCFAPTAALVSSRNR